MAKEIIIDENRGFQGVWIPKNLYMTNKFNARTKFFLVEVKSLSKNGYCYATDKHFADFLGISERMVQNIINDLKKRNYIRTEYEYDGDTKAIKRRLLILTQVFYNEFYNEKEENNGTEKNFGRGTEKNCGDKYNNNLSIPNSSITDITDNNAFSESKDSSKVDMYDYVPEKQEVDEPKKENRYISQDYTYEQLREHIKPVYEKSMKEKYGYTDKDTPIESMLDITVEFCKLYEQKIGHKHKVLSDSSYDRIADCFMNPPNKLSEDECDLDLETHMLMAEQYFITNYNKRGKFNGSVEKSFSHFMSGLIRDNLYWQTCV